jgi:hypothetical protein
MAKARPGACTGAARAFVAEKALAAIAATKNAIQNHRIETNRNRGIRIPENENIGKRDLD